MKKDQLFLSTIAPDAAEEARRHGLGLEIAEYCTAWNMDEQFETTHAADRGTNRRGQETAARALQRAVPLCR